MRIALVSQEYPPETAKGGIGSQTRSKAQGLAALGHDVTVISRTPPRTGGSEGRDGPVRVIRIEGFESRMPLFTEPADWLSYSLEVAAAVASVHAREPLDLVDFPEWGAEGYAHLLNRSEWNNIATVIHLHGPLVMFAHTMGWPDADSDFYRVGTHMEGACVRLADAVYSSSRCSIEWCSTYYGLDASLVPVIHTGVDTRLFAPVQARAERPTIVFAGKLTKNKGVHLLVKAACHLAREFPDLRVQLLGRGDGKVQAELEEIARSAGQPALLEFLGFASADIVAERFASAHFFVAPSQYEGGPGFVYLEAMACGLPVIACSGSGVQEVVRHGETGLLVPPSQVEPLIDAMRVLLSDGKLRREMGHAARSYVAAEADSRQCIKKLEAFYKAVVEGKPGAVEAPAESNAVQILQGVES